MSIELPALPYPNNALEPVLSAETIEYHYGKHHQSYVTKLNAQIDNDQSLEEIILNSDGGLFNNAAQVWNHNFYWHCMAPGGKELSSAELGRAINTDFGSMEQLKEAFLSAAAQNFASGWTWLVVASSGKLEILNTDDADTPIAHGITPILTVDVWEHAYYIDYRNARASYLDAWWSIINWEFVATQYTNSKAG